MLHLYAYTEPVDALPLQVMGFYVKKAICALPNRVV